MALLCEAAACAGARGRTKPDVFVDVLAKGGGNGELERVKPQAPDRQRQNAPVLDGPRPRRTWATTTTWPRRQSAIRTASPRRSTRLLTPRRRHTSAADRMVLDLVERSSAEHPPKRPAQRVSCANPRDAATAEPRANPYPFSVAEATRQVRANLSRRGTPRFHNPRWTPAIPTFRAGARVNALTATARIDVELFFQQLLNGLTAGRRCTAWWRWASTLVYGILHVPNFAHGALYMAGAYAVYYANDHAGPELLAGNAGAAAVVAVLSMLADRLVFHPLRNAPRSTT